MAGYLAFDFKKDAELIADLYNKKGGLVIGGERYKIDLIILDSKMSHEVSRAAVERLVYQDKVKFILGDETVDAWVPVTEANKVLVVAVSLRRQSSTQNTSMFFRDPRFTRMRLRPGAGLQTRTHR